MRPGRRGWTVLETMVAVIGLSMFLAIAAVAYTRYQEKVYRRLCHNQQRTLQGMIETLPAFDPTGLAGDPVAARKEMFAQLVKAGLLGGTLSGDEKSVESVKIKDPGWGDDSYLSYYILPDPVYMIACDHHDSAFVEE